MWYIIHILTCCVVKFLARCVFVPPKFLISKLVLNMDLESFLSNTPRAAELYFLINDELDGLPTNNQKGTLPDLESK